MKIKEYIKENGEGKYTIEKEYIVCFNADMGETRSVKYFVEYKDGIFSTSSPEALELNLGDNMGNGEGYLTEITYEKPEKDYSLKKDYNVSENSSEEFELIIGTNSGYFHKNENAVDFFSLYQEVAEKVAEKVAAYVSAVIEKKKVIYSMEWGCPCGGEDVYSVKGVWNPEYSELKDYKKAVYEISKILASELGQRTFTLTWRKVSLDYFTD